MKPERWQWAERLDRAASEVERAQHAAFLAEARADDDAPRAELAALPADGARSPGLPDTPALTLETKRLAAARLPAPAVSLAGQHLSRYRIIAQLGAGGMGEVWRAEDSDLGRQVAIKILPAAFTADAERVRRFEQEARAASALNHPNIITIHEIGTAVTPAGATHFIVTELIDGATLREQVDDGQLPPAVALALATQIASALKAAHASGIVHRDIKPENVMVRPDGLVKVLDFGLAKLAERRPPAPTALPADLVDTQAPTEFQARTEPETVMGTPAYMSPEQARGLEVDARTDIFSLGIILYEMLAGRRPFTGTTMGDLLVALLDREPPPLTQLAPAVPAPLAESVAKALLKDCAKRYQTMAEFLLELERLKLRLEFEAELARSGSASGPTPERRSAAPEARRARKTIDALAVLPLVNASADPEAEYLSDGLTESLINNLSRLPRLRVMARATVFRYKGRELDPRVVGSELDVRAVLTGRVLHRGNQLIIKVELVSTADGAQLWGEQYQRPFSDIFALEDEMAREISANLLPRLSGAQKKRLAKPPTTNAAAYQLYLQGRHHLNKWTAEGFQKALDYLQQALVADPQFALAHAGLSDALSDLCTRGHVAAHEYFPKAKAAALRALALDDTLAEAHATLAKALHYYDWDWPAAEREYKLALKLNPNHSTILIQYSMFLVSKERFAEALRTANRAQELDPLSSYVNLVRGWLLWLSQQDELCIQQGQKLIELEPGFYGGHWLVAVTCFQLGQYAEALPAYQKAHSLGNTPQLKVGLARIWAALGQPEQTRQVIAELQRQPHVPSYYLAEIYAELNEPEQAFAWLERAYEERDSHLVIFKLDRCFDKLRTDPRHASLVRRIGLPG